jgi:hypothetical protein
MRVVRPTLPASRAASKVLLTVLCIEKWAAPAGAPRMRGVRDQVHHSHSKQEDVLDAVLRTIAEDTPQRSEPASEN